MNEWETGARSQESGHRTQESEFRTQDSGHKSPYLPCPEFGALSLVS